MEACPCLVDFVSKVAFNYASGSSILSFTLKLTGLIGASEDGFKVLKVRLKNLNSPRPGIPFFHPSITHSNVQECSVLKLVFNPHHWQEAGLWEDPCLRIGWIQGLKMILQHSEALCFFAQAGNSSCRTFDLLLFTLLNKIFTKRLTCSFIVCRSY